MKKQKKIKKTNCKHIERSWCLNCDDWVQPGYCISFSHQDGLYKCVKCGEFFEE